MTHLGSRSGPCGRAEAGAVLVAVVWIAAALAVAQVALATRTVADVRAAEAAVARAAALHAAEAALTEAIDRLERDATDWSGSGGPFVAHLSTAPARLDVGSAVLADRDVPEVAVIATILGEGPTLRLDAIARVRGHERAVRADVRPSSVADLAYGLVHAVVDPDVTGGTPRDCGVPRWLPATLTDPRGPVEPESAGVATPCLRTRLEPPQTVRGPVHVDDHPRIDVGWIASGPLTSAAPQVLAGAGPAVLNSADVVEVDPDGLLHAPPLRLPDDPFDGQVGGAPVCRLRGPTLIRLDGHRVRVRSPRSHPRHDDAGGPPVSCHGLDLASVDGTTELVLEAAGVIEVRRDPAARCVQHPLGIDPAEDADVEQRCGDGTAYVWGTYAGDRSILAEDDVRIVWDLTPTPAAAEDPDGPLLGLVAGGSVVVRRTVGPPLRVVAPFGTDTVVAGPDLPPFGPYPMDAPTPVPVRWDEPRIVAAVAALGGSFRLQNHARGQWSDIPIVVEGALVQRFSGPTWVDHRDATGAVQGRTGRALDIRHDLRLAGRVPPALPRLRGGRLRILTWEEIRVAEAGGDG